MKKVLKADLVKEVERLTQENGRLRDDLSDAKDSIRFLGQENARLDKLNSDLAQSLSDVRAAFNECRDTFSKLEFGAAEFEQAKALAAASDARVKDIKDVMTMVVETFVEAVR